MLVNIVNAYFILFRRNMDLDKFAPIPKRYKELVEFLFREFKDKNYSISEFQKLDQEYCYNVVNESHTIEQIIGLVFISFQNNKVYLYKKYAQHKDFKAAHKNVILGQFLILKNVIKISKQVENHIIEQTI